MELTGELQLRDRPYEAVDILIDGEDLDAAIEEHMQKISTSRDDRSAYEMTSYGQVRITIERI